MKTLLLILFGIFLAGSRPAHARRDLVQRLRESGGI
jgi:hypothetical protein